jgi:HAD superfamily hydrolase (TIGR01459 family)
LQLGVANALVYSTPTNFESASLPNPVILSHFSEIAPDYDALICDVWGVVHNGQTAHQPACEALKKFRATRGPVVLVSNAPRPVRDLKVQFARYGVPDDSYDTIITSGAAAHDELARRVAQSPIKMFHLGPDRDRGVFDDLPVSSVPEEQADIVLCTGLFDDDTETPETYRAQLTDMKKRGLTMLCANPDLVVQRGGKLVYCAGALAKLYEELGGTVTYYGKPHRPIYDIALAAARSPKRPLAIGDAVNTDLRGANGAGMDALFIGDGIHAAECVPFDAETLGRLFARAGVEARAAMQALVW